MKKALLLGLASLLLAGCGAPPSAIPPTPAGPPPAPTSVPKPTVAPPPSVAPKPAVTPTPPNAGPLATQAAQLQALQSTVTGVQAALAGAQQTVAGSQQTAAAAQQTALAAQQQLLGIQTILANLTVSAQRTAAAQQTATAAQATVAATQTMAAATAAVRTLTPRPSGPVPAISLVTADLSDTDVSPNAFNIPVGSMILFRNAGATAHQLGVTDHSWVSPQIPPGQGFGRTFQNPGTFTVVCLDVPSITAQVTVS